MRRGAWGLTLLVLACEAPAPAATTAPSVAPPPASRWPTSPPHAGAITLVAVDLRASAALSADVEGRVLLWPRLDGRQQPVEISWTPAASTTGSEPHGQVELPDLLDVMVEPEGGWRVLVGAGAAVQLVHVDPQGEQRAVTRFDDVTAALLLGGGRTLISHGSSLTLFFDVGSTRELDLAAQGKLGSEQAVSALLGDPEREAVVLVSGGMRATTVHHYWAGGAMVEVFEGALTPLDIAEDGVLSTPRAAEAILATDPPGPLTFVVSEGAENVAFRRWVDLDVGGETELESAVQVVNLRGGDASGRVRDPAWFDMVAGLDGASGARGVIAQGERQWLHVRGQGEDLYLGAAYFEPNVVAFSPDGEQLAWITNGSDEAHTQLWLTRHGQALANPAPLPDVGHVGAMIWAEPRGALVVEGEGALYGLDPTTGEVSELGELESELLELEHDRRSGLTLLHGAWSCSALLWREGQPGPALALDELFPFERFGLVPGEHPRMWVLSDELGLAVFEFDTLDELAALDQSAIQASFAALPRDPRQLFGLTHTAAGEQIFDWGDHWEVLSEGRTHVWPRDIPVFGPLRPSPDGAALLTLPECDDDPWRLVIHPGRASALTPGSSWVHEIPEHAQVRWSPDGTKLAIAAGSGGGELLDVATGTRVDRWTQGDFEVLGHTPPRAPIMTGRCRTLNDYYDRE